MSKNVVMRELKDGSGFSACNASEENVGKRRCNHKHSSVSFNVQINKIDNKLQEVVVSEEYNKLDKRDKKAVVKAFVESLTPIDKETADFVLDKLRNM